MEKTVNKGGIGFLGLLTIAFIVLKLTNHINWSWWLVLAAIWMPVAIFVAVVVGWFILYLLAELKPKR